MSTKHKYQLVTFEYCKQGEFSPRMGVVVHQPTDLYAILEVDAESDVDVVALQEEFAERMKLIDEQRAVLVQDMMNKYCVQYKNFKQGGVHDFKEAK